MSCVQLSLLSVSLYTLYHETLDDRYPYKCRSPKYTQYFKVIILQPFIGRPCASSVHALQAGTYVKAGHGNGIVTLCRVKLEHWAASSISPLKLRLDSGLPNEMKYRARGAFWIFPPRPLSPHSSYEFVPA